MSIITITGDLASGKSLIAKKIAKKLDAVYFSTGLIQREIAAKYGMTTLELNKYSESHPEIDREIDDGVKALQDRDRDLVVDSRMAWHFLPHSFKIYLSTNIVRAAERVIADTERSNEPVYADRNDAMLKLQERKRSENKRYLQLYDADCAKLSNFDLVVDTTYSVPEDTLEAIIQNYERWRGNRLAHRYWYSPRSILPLCPPGDFDEDGRQVVEVLMCEGSLYAYAGHALLFAALEVRNPYLPVEVIAADEANVRGEGSARQIVEENFSDEILSQWEREFGFQYLALSGRFSERKT